MLFVSAAVVSLPLTGLLPLHPTEAVQLVELVALQLSCALPPAATVPGDAVSVTTGHGITVPPIRLMTLPPSPEHMSRKVTYSFGEYGPAFSWPATGLAPDHASVAIQLFTLVVDQFSVKTPLTVFDIVKLRVGADAANTAFDAIEAITPTNQSAMDGRRSRNKGYSRNILQITVERWKVATLPSHLVFATLDCIALDGHSIMIVNTLCRISL